MNKVAVNMWVGGCIWAHLPSRKRTVVRDKGVCTSFSRESRMIPYVFVQVTPSTNRSERIKQDRLTIVTARRSQASASAGYSEVCAGINVTYGLRCAHCQHVKRKEICRTLTVHSAPMHTWAHSDKILEPQNS